MSVHFDFANGKFVYTWQVISDDGTKYFTSDGQLVDKSNLIPSAVTLAFLEYTTASVSSFQLKAHGTVNYDVDWGDGSTETGVTANNKDHTYSTAGVYTIKITPAEGSTFRPLQYGATDGTTSLAKVVGLGGSQLGSSLVNAWRNVSSLNSFGAIDTSSVTTFTRAWANCSGLTSFPLIDTSSATNLGFTWSACSGLTSFPALDTSSVTGSFRRTWYQNTSLTTYPANQFDNIQTTASNGFEDAFRSCALTAQSIENILTSLDTNGASNITLGISGGTNANASTWSYDAVDAYVDLANKGWTISQNGTPNIVYKINNSGTSFTLPSAGTINVDIDWGDGSSETVSNTANNPSHTYASAGIYEIRISINSGGYRPRFGLTSDSDAQLISAVIANNGGISSMDQAFRDVPNLTSYKQIESASSSVTSLNKAFQGCSSLASFPVIDTSSVTNFLDAWKNCSSLTSFPSLDYSSATQIHYAWDGCTSLADFPANQFDSTGTLASFAFTASWRLCALTAQSIENILTSLDTNGAQNITLGINGGTNAAKSTWSTAANTAYNNLVTKGWTITFNS